MPMSPDEVAAVLAGDAREAAAARTTNAVHPPAGRQESGVTKIPEAITSAMMAALFNHSFAMPTEAAYDLTHRALNGESVGNNQKDVLNAISAATWGGTSPIPRIPAGAALAVAR